MTKTKTLPKAEPRTDIRCKVCSLPATWDSEATNYSTMQKGYQSKEGWMAFQFPVPKNGTWAPEEVAWLCPKDATRVAEYVAHLSVPMLGDEDLF